MNYQLTYDEDSRLILSGLECGCSCEHHEPREDIYVGNGILKNIARYIRRRGLGVRCTLVSDSVTWELAGQTVFQLLKGDGFFVTPLIIRRDEPMEPDERAVGEVLLGMDDDTEFFISVGSGSITDVTRVTAARTGRPMVCVGTAPSMDGYTSVVCPLLLKGVKIHRSGHCPEIIICDIDILKTAPLHMIACGVGDVLGKYIAKADWIIGNIINDEPYCPVCGQIVTDAVNRLMDNIDEIRSRSDQGIRILIEALLLAGMTIMIIGHTRAVASVEHNIAHYWDMVQLNAGKQPPRHGAAVGAATLMVWPIFTRFAQEDLSALNLDAVRANRLTREERVRWMLDTYGETAAADIMTENEGDFLSEQELLRRVHRAQERFGEIKACIGSLPAYDRIRDAMARLGAPLTYAECGMSSEAANLSMHCAKDYRTRYTLFKLLDECGLLKEYLNDYPIDWTR